MQGSSCSQGCKAEDHLKAQPSPGNSAGQESPGSPTGAPIGGLKLDNLVEVAALANKYAIYELKELSCKGWVDEFLYVMNSAKCTEGLTKAAEQMKTDDNVQQLTSARNVRQLTEA